METHSVHKAPNNCYLHLVNAYIYYDKSDNEAGRCGGYAQVEWKLWVVDNNDQYAAALGKVIGTLEVQHFYSTLLGKERGKQKEYVLYTHENAENNGRSISTMFCIGFILALMLVTYPTPQHVNLTQTAIFTCNATGYNVSYQWTIGSGLFPNKVIGINSTTLVIPDVRSYDDNTYTCVASYVGRNISSNATKLTVTGMNIRNRNMQNSN